MMRGGRDAGGFLERAVLGAIARLVPRAQRASWTDEWRAEIAGARTHGVARGTRGRARMLHGALRDALVVRGMTPAPARGSGWTRDGVLQELGQSARALIARPGFTLVTVLTLALGVGATTAMFSAVHAVLLRALPYPAADRIVVLKRSDLAEGTLASGVSAANVRDVAARSRTLRHAAVADGIHGLRLVDEGRAESLRAWVVAEGFFDALGAQVQLGRTFLAGEYVSGNEHVVLLADGTWRTRYGGDPGVVGRTLILDGVAHTVVGVLPPDFGYPTPADAWTPRPPGARDADARGRATMDGIARLAPGVTLAAAQREIDGIAAELAALHPTANAGTGIRLVPLRQHLFGEVTSPLLLLLAAVALVLLISAANVAGVQLARGLSRSREYALRGALGASPARILRLVLMESVLLAASGGVLGVALAYMGVELIAALGPDHLPRIDGLAIDATVLGFAALVSLGSALLAGITPALQASRQDLRTALASASRGSTAGPRVGGLRDRLVIAEIAVALVLAIGAGLLVRSLDRLLEIDPGFAAEGRLTFQVWSYDEQHRNQLGFFDAATARVRALPGVEAVGLTTDLPFADRERILARGRTTPFVIDGMVTPGSTVAPAAGLIGIDAGYSDALGIRVVVGRPFSELDGAESLPVAIVNEAFVRRHLSGRDAVGSSITLDGAARSRVIVGVFADVRRAGLEAVPLPEIYVPLAQVPANGLAFVAKVQGDPATYSVSVRNALWEADPQQAIWAMRPLTDLLSDDSRQRRFNTVLLGAFAALALLLAAVGVYGLTAFSIEQRIKEIGVRRALGGGTWDILASVLRRIAGLALLGAAIGLAGSLALTRLLRGMLFGVGPLDPPTFIAFAVLVVGTALAAALLPATRATRVDPLVALSRPE